jgi:hypothetical protein
MSNLQKHKHHIFKTKKVSRPQVKTSVNLATAQHATEPQNNPAGKTSERVNKRIKPQQSSIKEDFELSFQGK